VKSPFALSAVALTLASASVNAAVTVVHFGDGGTSLPVTIEALGTTISNNPHDVSERFSINSSSSDVLFTRHIVSVEDDICYYWFRSMDDPGAWPDTEAWNDVYWYVMDDCVFVDGAVEGDDNFVLLRNAEGLDIGVLRISFQDPLNTGGAEAAAPTKILAYAVDANGLSFADGVAAITAVPEPSTALLGGVALLGGLLRRKRRD
jgi:hypothetical protein